MTDFYVQTRGGIWVNVRPSLRELTTYVLLEQEDWFEKEIRFLRRWLAPGMRAIDIGANRGVYALTMAKAVTPDGAIYAFEPTESIAAALNSSVARNQFDNLQVFRTALSNYEGTADLHTYSNSEMNSFTRHSSDNGVAVVRVPVSTLDRHSQMFHWNAIDFVKIDAEGQEAQIIEGGRRFLTEQSPLVMFEIPNPHRDDQIASLIAAFRKLQYDCYRLVGPDCLLVPVEHATAFDEFELNLFACKGDRAAQLAAAGLLVPLGETVPSPPRGDARAYFANQIYARCFASVAFCDPDYRAALEFYAAWRAPNLSAAARFAALERAVSVANEVAKSRASISRLSSFARIATESGARRIAVDALFALATQLLGAAQAPDEPLVPPTPRFDAIEPGQSSRAWLLAAAFEASEKNAFHSSYYQRLTQTAEDLYTWLCGTPFQSAEMERRRQLLLLRHGKQAKLMATSWLIEAGPDNLNATFWASR